MGFFQGASNIRILGGQFNHIKNGNQIIDDQSTHYNNVNSFNTNNNTTIDSHNDRSITTYAKKGSLPDYRRRSPKIASQTHDSAPYFPPPRVHPALQPPLPLGSGPVNVSHINSYNVDDTRLLDSYNDYSQSYGVRKRTPTPPAVSKRRKRRHDVHHPNQGQQLLPPAPPQHVPQIHTKTSRQGSSTSHVQFADGDIQTMGQDIQQTLATLMAQVERQTALTPSMECIPPRVHDDQNESDDSEDSEEEERPSRMQDVPPPPSVNLTHRLAGLTLEESPQGPSTLRHQPPATSEDGNEEEESDEDEEEEEDEDEEEEDEEEEDVDAGPPSLNIPPVKLNIPPVNITPVNIPPLPANLGPSFSRPRPAYRHNPSHPPFPTPALPPNVNMNVSPNVILNTFNLPTQSIRGPAVFNTVHGNMVQVDRSVHVRNINSGNTVNRLVKDSYNHAPITVYGNIGEPSTDSMSKRKKEKRRP